MDFGFQITGNAFGVLGSAAKEAHRAIMAAVYKAASKVQARAKINVHQKLNTTGQSKGTLSRSVTVIPDRGKLEAAIGPSVIYGRIHELGGVIVPVKAGALCFKIGEQTIITQRVVMPARPYMQPALDESEPEFPGIFEDGLRGLFTALPGLAGRLGG